MNCKLSECHHNIASELFTLMKTIENGLSCYNCNITKRVSRNAMVKVCLLFAFTVRRVVVDITLSLSETTTLFSSSSSSSYHYYYYYYYYYYYNCLYYYVNVTPQLWRMLWCRHYTKGASHSQWPKVLFVISSPSAFQQLRILAVPNKADFCNSTVLMITPSFLSHASNLLLLYYYDYYYYYHHYLIDWTSYFCMHDVK